MNGCLFCVARVYHSYEQPPGEVKMPTPGGEAFSSEVRGRLLGVKAPLCRGSCQSKGLTEGVYAIDTVKAIVRSSPTKFNRTPPPSPSVPPPPTRREAYATLFLRIEFVRVGRAAAPTFKIELPTAPHPAALRPPSPRGRHFSVPSVPTSISSAYPSGWRVRRTKSETVFR